MVAATGVVIQDMISGICWGHRDVLCGPEPGGGHALSRGVVVGPSVAMFQVGSSVERGYPDQEE